MVEASLSMPLMSSSTCHYLLLGYVKCVFVFWGVFCLEYTYKPFSMRLSNDREIIPNIPPKMVVGCIVSGHLGLRI